MANAPSTATNAPEQKQVAKIKHSHKNRSYNSFQTVRFGEITPFFYDELVPNDRNVRLGANLNLRSMNLKSPLMQDLKAIGRYFVVPYQCILPLSWERIFTNPTLGDDVPRDANCLLSVKALSPLYHTVSPNSSFSGPDALTYLIYEWALNEVVFAPCGLSDIFKLAFNKLSKPAFAGSSVASGLFTRNNAWSEDLYNFFIDNMIVLESGSHLFSYYNYEGDRIVDFMRDLLFFVQDFPDFSPLGGDWNAAASTLFNKWKVTHARYDTDVDLEENIGILWAYQLVCAHYYSNDYVDFVYSSELFRQVISSLLFDSLPQGGDTYAWNGLNVPYDYLSQHSVETLLNAVSSDDTFVTKAFILVMTLFRFNRSLKFEDYFSALKTRPLAVGSGTSIKPAADGSVSVIDVSTSIQYQRFYNAVNRVGRKFSEFQRGIFGTGVGYDFHDPKHIGSFEVNISSPETDNTTGDTMSKEQTTSSNFRGGTSSKFFEFDCDRFSYVLGLLTFDISRSYVDIVTPLARRYDRFDFFNPFMQYIGDESIPITDYDARTALITPSNRRIKNLNEMPAFAYGVRHYPYKVRPNEAMESFRTSLPSWTFIDDSQKFADTQTRQGPVFDSDFIRCKQRELNSYYSSLTGSQLDSYFHFVCSFFNRCEMDRPMVTSPQIIG